MPTFIHASAAEWIRAWIEHMKISGDIETKGVGVFSDATLKNFPVAFNRR
jgi:hypothetical protein